MKDHLYIFNFNIVNNFLIKNKIFAAGVSLIIIFTCLEVLSIVLFSVLDKDIRLIEDSNSN